MGRVSIWWENHPRALYARFVCVMLGFLAVHATDVILDCAVLVDLYQQGTSMDYFAAACAIMVIGAIFQSVVGAFLSNAGKTLRDYDKESAEVYNITSDYPIVGAVLGFTHLGILVEAAYSIKAGAKTQGFAASRVLEAVVEAGPQSLLQLFIALRRARAPPDTDDGGTDRYTDDLLLASVAISVVSMALGLAEYEKVSARIGFAGHGTGEARARRLYAHGNAAGDPLYMSFASRYFVCLVLCRACEVAARMALLACFGARYGGGGLVAVLAFDWAVLVVHGAWRLRGGGSGGGGPPQPRQPRQPRCECLGVAALLGIPLSMMATMSLPFTHDLLGDRDLKPFFAAHWLTKAGEAVFLVPNAVQLIFLDDAGGAVTAAVAAIGLAAFVLQFPLLFLVLKWASNVTDYPVLAPSDVYVFPCAGGGGGGGGGGRGLPLGRCCDECDGGTGGIESVADILIHRLEDNDGALTTVKITRGMATPRRIARLGTSPLQIWCDR